MADWSELPLDLLDLILGKLSIPDYVCFGVVCVQWHLAFSSKQRSPPKPQSPWLMLPGDTNTIANFFSITDKKVYKIRCPEPMIRRRICIGSSHGWLITVEETSELHLLNPLTSVQIPLPPVTTLPFVKAVRDSQGRVTKFLLDPEQAVDDPAATGRPRAFSLEHMRCLFFSKAILSAAPDESGGFTVMMICGLFYHRLVFARDGDKAWTLIRTRYGFSDVIYHCGKFYTITLGYMLHAWEPDGLSFRPRVIIPDFDVELYGYFTYLVASLDGRLMMVCRERDYGDDEGPADLKTTMFMVYSLEEREVKWKKVKSLREQVLFLGNNQSMCLSSVDFPELKRNSVYFTDDYLERTSRFRHQSRDLGVFYLERKRRQPIDSLRYSLNWPPPVWLTPSLS